MLGTPYTMCTPPPLFIFFGHKNFEETKWRPKILKFGYEYKGGGGSKNWPKFYNYAKTKYIYKGENKWWQAAIIAKIATNLRSFWKKLISEMAAPMLI